MSEIISVPIETYVMKVRAIMCSTVSPIMIRQTEVEQTTIRIIHINPETPSSAGNINRAVEIISSQKPTILCVTQYPPEVIITNIQSFIIITDHICLGLFNAIAPSGHPGTHTTKSGMLIAANIG